MTIRRTLLRLCYPLLYAGLKAYWRLRGGRSFGVTIVLRHEESILLVETSYRAGLELPGGLRHRHEDAKTAAIRELNEELGLQLAPGQLSVLLEHAFSKHSRRFEETIFLADLAEPPELRIDQIEIIYAGFYPLAEIQPPAHKISLARAVDRLLAQPENKS